MPTYLGLPELERDADVAVIPLPYEGTVSWGGGAAAGPQALLEASTQVELYDERLRLQISDHIGILTTAPTTMPDDPAGAVEAARAAVAAQLAAGRWPAAVGGEHSLTLGVYRALAQHQSTRGGELGVIQLDAHADLRPDYEGTPLSHACVMARIREHTDAVVQLGIRSLSREEAERIDAEGLAVGFMHELRSGRFDVEGALDHLPQRVLLTIDVDALDLALIRSTGTPEPGGFTWDEVLSLLALIARKRTVVGVDVMELCGGDPASAFCAARLLHHVIGQRFGRQE